MAQVTDKTTTIPDAAKKPQDRRPKQSKDGTQTVKVHGVELTIVGDALDDFELLDDLAALDDGEGQRLPKVMRRLVGEKWRDVMSALRDEETGRVSVDDAGTFIHDVLEAVAPNS